MKTRLPLLVGALFGLYGVIEFYIPARALIGLRTRMMTATQGTAVLHHNFHEYRPIKAAIPGRALGVLISLETEKATAYAMDGLQDRGVLFIDAQTDAMNCGTCGTACPMGQMCVTGACRLPCTAPMTVCGAGAMMTCVDTQTNASNCGTCGNACAMGQSCVNGLCG